MKRFGNIPLAMLPRIVVGNSYDEDAAAFLTAGNIANSTVAATINAHSLALKAVTDKSNYITAYPFVCDAATNNDRLAQFKFNLFDARDLDAAKRIIFAGSITADPLYIQGNGTNGCCSTYIYPSADMPTKDFTICIYSRTNGGLNTYDFGAANAPFLGLGVCLKWSDNFFYLYPGSTPTGFITGPNNQRSDGFFLIKRVGDTVTVKRNNVIIYSGNVAGDLRANQILKLMCMSRTGNADAYFSNRQYTDFTMLKIGTNDAQDTALYNAILSKETALARNV